MVLITSSVPMCGLCLQIIVLTPLSRYKLERHAVHTPLILSLLTIACHLELYDGGGGGSNYRFPSGKSLDQNYIDEDSLSHRRCAAPPKWL